MATVVRFTDVFFLLSITKQYRIAVIDTFSRIDGDREQTGGGWGESIRCGKIEKNRIKQGRTSLHR